MKSSRKDHVPEEKLKMILSKTVLNGDCMEWTGNFFRRYGSKKDNGKWAYPYIYFKNKSWRGNRLVMFLIHGYIPERMNALHKCDNNKCLNPAHLYFGSQKQNVYDMITRGRKIKTKQCNYGHDRTCENTSTRHRRDGTTYSVCKECVKRYNKVARGKK